MGKSRVTDGGSIAGVLRHCAQETPNRVAYQFAVDGQSSDASLTYASLDRQAMAIAVELQRTVERGDRALLLFPPGDEFLPALFGCFYAGVIAIPAPPPDAARLKRTLPRLESIVADAQATVALTTKSILAQLEGQVDDFVGLRAVHWIDTAEIGPSVATASLDEARASDIAILQYTSGSTSKPKGVMVSHGNVMHQCAALAAAAGYSSDSITATWMPYFHDYGLIEGLMQPMFVGAPCYIMSPVAFIKRPVRWLELISRYGVTHSQGPNFAYDHCVRRVDAAQIGSLDLSRWLSAANGAEPVLPDTMRAFYERFRDCGFRWASFSPAYGLAEATLVVSVTPPGAEPKIYRADAAAFGHGRVEPALEGHAPKELAGCGQVLGDMRVEIVNPETCQRCNKNEVGEIWVAGPSIAQGYWNQSLETSRTFQAHISDDAEGPFLRTGDLGYLEDGELYVTGRHKDLIIIHGLNHYPQDIELTAERSDTSLRPGSGAAFSVTIDGEERLVIVHEVQRSALKDLNTGRVMSAIRRAVFDEHELFVYAVVLLQPGSIHKTSSGKIQRAACQRSFIDEKLNVIASWSDSSRREAVNSTPTASPDTAPTLADSSSQERADDVIHWLRDYANHHLNSQLMDERRCIPPYVVLDLGNQGLFGMQTPREFGGLDLTHVDTVRVYTQLSAIDQTLTLSLCVQHALGIRPIMKYAPFDVRDEVMPRLAQGRELSAFALTEPGSGSDPRSMACIAVPDGNDRWRLRGRKVWSGLASWASVINVFVQMQNERGQSVGVTGFMVRRGQEGLVQGPEAQTMGMRGMVQNEVDFHDTPVGLRDMLGEAGQGMAVAQDAMLFGRLFIGAMGLGGMKRCAQLMLRYAGRRRISTGRLLDNPVTLFRLGELRCGCAALEALLTKVASLLDAGELVPEEVFAACKIIGPELLGRATDDLVQLLGGRGYIETNEATRLFRDARVLRIVEGPTETLNMFLGAALFRRSDTLRTFFIDHLSGVDIFESLLAVVDEVRVASRGQGLTDELQANRWAQSLAGELAHTAILWAVVRDTHRGAIDDALSLACQWSEQRFHQRCQWARSQADLGFVFAPALQLDAMQAELAESIGDIEQTLAGEEHALDALLRRDGDSLPEDSTATTISANSPQAELPTGLEHVDAIRTWLSAWLHERLGVPPDSVHSSSPFADLGVDSVSAVEMAMDLEQWLGVPCEATLLWSYPTIESLSQYLAQQKSVATSASADPVKAESNAVASLQSSETEDLDSLSDDDLTALLAAEVGALQQRRRT